MLSSSFNQSEIIEGDDVLAKRFCADYKPSSAALIARYQALPSSTHSLILRPGVDPPNSVALFAQKPFESDELITEYVGQIRPVSNTEPVSPKVVR